MTTITKLKAVEDAFEAVLLWIDDYAETTGFETVEAMADAALPGLRSVIAEMEAGEPLRVSRVEITAEQRKALQCTSEVHIPGVQPKAEPCEAGAMCLMCPDRLPKAEPGLTDAEKERARLFTEAVQRGESALDAALASRAAKGVQAPWQTSDTAFVPNNPFPKDTQIVRTLEPDPVHGLQYVADALEADPSLADDGEPVICLWDSGESEPVVKDSLTTEPVRPQNCGTSYCSCIECVMNEPVQEPWWLLESTKTLARNLAKEFYPEVPQWQCLDDLAGVISQIDNMTTGLMRKTDPDQKPVAWRYMVNGVHENFWPVEPPDDAYDEGTLTPLYAAPQAKPLTDEQIVKQHMPQTGPVTYQSMLTFARAIEAAHGIASKDKGDV